MSVVDYLHILPMTARAVFMCRKGRAPSLPIRAFLMKKKGYSFPVGFVNVGPVIKVIAIPVLQCQIFLLPIRRLIEWAPDFGFVPFGLESAVGHVSLPCFHARDDADV